MYYARAAGMDEAVALAARDHWAPKGPEDAVPVAPVSIAVALAEKIDTLTGFWVIDEKPTGSKDPFALRRAALGVIRLVLENGVRLGLTSRLQQGLSLNGAVDTPALAADLVGFFHDRLKVFLKDQGIRHDVIDACLAMPGNDDLTLLVNRAKALSALMKTEDGTNLVQGFKRANNILTQAESKDGVEYSYGADVKFAETEAERALFAALDAAEAAIAPAMADEDFGRAMAAMAGLRAPVDAFFDAAQINTENAVVRRNRLNLLSRIRKVVSGVADLSRLDG